MSQGVLYPGYKREKGTRRSRTRILGKNRSKSITGIKAKTKRYIVTIKLEQDKNTRTRTGIGTGTGSTRGRERR